jgi:hypothetical protein
MKRANNKAKSAKNPEEIFDANVVDVLVPSVVKEAFYI